ncbi:MAG: TlpA disulfide reductase family protein, partial [Clostridia bacterium]
TYCGPCLSEMPDLGQIAEEYKDKGLQIVGIVSDVVEGGNVDAEQRELAKKVVAETKANYVHILPIDEVLQGLMSQIIAVPTTLFLDAQGNQVGEIVFGSKTKTEWLQIIDEHLATIK